MKEEIAFNFSLVSLSLSLPVSDNHNIMFYVKMSTICFYASGEWKECFSVLITFSPDLRFREESLCTYL